MYQRQELTKTQTRQMLCDFCMAKDPVWVYAARRMSTGERVHCWRWAACPLCADCIEREDWNTIRRRMFLAFKRRFLVRVSDEFVEAAIENALLEFFLWAA